MLQILPGKALTLLMGVTGWTRGDIVRQVTRPEQHLAPAPDEGRVAQWEAMGKLGLPISKILHSIAAAAGFVWFGGAEGEWLPARPPRLTGANVVMIRERLGWSQARLAHELDTKQQSVAQWEADPDRRLSGTVSYALRAVEARYVPG